MKKTLLTFSLLAALAACNKSPANNIAAAGNAAGLPVPPDRAGTLSAPSDGQQAMPAGLDCVRNRLSPDQRRDVAAAAMEQAPRDDPRAQLLLQTAAACGDELGWSQEKRQFATIFSISAAGATGIRQELSGEGVQIQELDQVILSDRELMTAADNNQLNSEAGQAFAVRHRAELERIAGGRSLEGELGTKIGTYIGFIAAAQSASSHYASAS